jgi:hypothetical protein
MRSFFWSTLLVIAGALLLLGNFNLIQFDVFELLSKAWPVILIAIGLDIFLSGYRKRNV